jgi:F0F1-type ATP synthase assembly protein I
MDGLVRSVGDALAGLLDRIAAAVGAAVGGAVDAVSSVAPLGLVPLAVIGLIILVLVFRR